MNIVVLSGRLTKDIEVKEFGETKVITNTIAVYRCKDKNNNPITDFIEFKAFNGVANILSNYCKKGSKIEIKGQLQVDMWKDEENNPHSKTIVYADSIGLLDEKKQDTEQAKETEQHPYMEMGNEKEEEKPIVKDEDLPF